MKKKEAVVFCRVSRRLKQAVEALAAERGEAESVIIREAVREYLERRKSCFPEPRAGTTTAPAGTNGPDSATRRPEPLNPKAPRQ